MISPLLSPGMMVPSDKIGLVVMENKCCRSCTCKAVTYFVQAADDRLYFTVHILVFWTGMWLPPFASSVCFYTSQSLCFSRLPQYRWPGCQRELRAPGPDPGFKVDQREHRLLWRRLQSHHCVWFWDRSLVCQPANPLPPFWRYSTEGGWGWYSCGACALEGRPLDIRTCPCGKQVIE